MSGVLQDLTAMVRVEVMKNPTLCRSMAMDGTFSFFLHKAIAAEYRARGLRYDPEIDHRVRYLRQVIETARVGNPKTDADLTAVVDLLLEKEEGAA